jgi:hypothetical protein
MPLPSSKPKYHPLSILKALAPSGPIASKDSRILKVQKKNYSL